MRQVGRKNEVKGIERNAKTGVRETGNKREGTPV